MYNAVKAFWQWRSTDPLKSEIWRPQRSNLCHKATLVPGIHPSTVAVVISLKLTSAYVFPLTPNLEGLLIAQHPNPSAQHSDLPTVQPPAYHSCSFSSPKSFRPITRVRNALALHTDIWVWILTPQVRSYVTSDKLCISLKPSVFAFERVKQA